ncbi:MAG: Na/Pi cotransporter family protein [Nanoarchaeota archaeon]|nr:Na/Pi cotransporter family protein [Nanoarchaeota archaeon]MBU4493660.1 Na/Pi cotransporter family protein [Nanoarchaeota archaeon]
METLMIIFRILGGLALFLYGIYLLSEGLQKAAGRKLKVILEKLTDRPIKGILGGALITAIIQSSSITTVTLVGLINAGLMSLEQSAGVIIGSNIGTTITAQLVAFKVGKYALPIIAIGTALLFIGKKKKTHYIGQVFLGFGLLFLGMNFMADGARPLQDSVFFLNMITSFSEIPVLGVLAGALFTGIIQSSSATSGLVIAMGMENIISLKAAIAIIIGANIGTCATVLIASIGSSLSSKRAAWFHLIFKLIGAIIFIPFISLFTYLVSLTSNNLPRQIANAHTLFNVSTAFLLLPFIFVIIRFIKVLIPGKDVRIDRGTKFLEKRVLNTPSIALSQAGKETVRMAGITQIMLKESKIAFLEGRKDLIDIVIRKEDAVDDIFEALNNYLSKISEKSLNKQDTKKLAILMHSVGDIERVGDHVNNIVELVERKNKEKLKFSKYAMKELEVMFEIVENVYDKAVIALKDDDKVVASEIDELEMEVDRKEKEFEHNHIERIKKKICNPASGIIFVDTLRNLERISDHATNIGNAVIAGF